MTLIGDPAPKTTGLGDPAAGPGAPLPQGTKLLSVRAADPDGGPPWGIRVYRTGRDAACWQVGRVISGRLGLLGIAGTFGDDGLLHELPVERDRCRALDANGRLFAYERSVAHASGQAGSLPCRIYAGPPDPTASRPDRSQPACRAGGLRVLRVGFLGPRGRVATTRPARRVRVDPGEDGAFLFVDRAGFDPRTGNLGRSALEDPVTARYRDGARRVVADVPLLESVPSPFPRGAPPPGYADPVLRLPAARRLRSRLHVTPRRVGRNVVYTVRYRIPVTVRRFGVDYGIAVTGPRRGSGAGCGRPMDFRGFMSEGNVRRGRLMTAKLTPGIAQRWGRGWCPGRYRITVYLHDLAHEVGRHTFTAP